jgi:hypothetical protein
MLVLLLLACRSAEPEPLPLGQWVWSEADAELFREARAAHPDAVAGVHVATVRWDSGFRNDLALAPTIVGDAPVAVVIRVDDSAHAAWDELTDEAFAEGLDAALARVVTLVRSRDVEVVEVQLDYDCPVRRLDRWARVLEHLRAGSLSGERVWVTSLVAHVRDPAYAGLRGVVDGHVLQVFDTGDDASTAAEVGDLAVAAGLPYRLGVGAFERDGTDHRAWFSRTPEACLAPLCEARWVFPAGRPYLDLLGDTP